MELAFKGWITLKRIEINMRMQCLFCFQYRVASKSCFNKMKITSWYLPSVVEWKHSFIRCWALNYLLTARLLKLINEKRFHKDSGSTKCSVNHFSTNSSRWENTNSSMAEEKVYKWGNMAWKSFCSEPIWLELEGRVRFRVNLQNSNLF